MTGARQKKRMKLRDKADTMFSQYIRQRDGACRRCGARDWLQCCHVVGRAYLSLRWDPSNAITMDRACHMWQTHHPLEGDEFFGSLGIDVDALKRRAMVEPAMDPEHVIAWLKKELA